MSNYFYQTSFCYLQQIPQPFYQALDSNFLTPITFINFTKINQNQLQASNIQGINNNLNYSNINKQILPRHIQIKKLDDKSFSCPSNFLQQPIVPNYFSDSDLKVSMEQIENFPLETCVKTQTPDVLKVQETSSQTKNKNPLQIEQIYNKLPTFKSVQSSQPPLTFYSNVQQKLNSFDVHIETTDDLIRKKMIKKLKNKFQKQRQLINHQPTLRKGVEKNYSQIKPQTINPAKSKRIIKSNKIGHFNNQSKINIDHQKDKYSSL